VRARSGGQHGKADKRSSKETHGYSGSLLDWVTVNVRPAIVSVPVRGLLPVFFVTLYLTVPDPVPESPFSTVMNASFDTAVHVQPAAVVTAMVGGVCASLSSE